MLQHSITECDHFTNRWMKTTNYWYRSEIVLFQDFTLGMFTPGCCCYWLKILGSKFNFVIVKNVTSYTLIGIWWTPQIIDRWDLLVQLKIRESMKVTIQWPYFHHQFPAEIWWNSWCSDVSESYLDIGTEIIPLTIMAPIERDDVINNNGHWGKKSDFCDVI